MPFDGDHGVYMRDRSDNSKQTAESIGEKVAAEFSNLFFHSATRISADRREQRRLVRQTLHIRTSILRAVDGYNERAPRSFQLAVLDRGDRLIFNSSGVFTLTLLYGVHQVMLDPTGEEVAGPVPLILEVWPKGDHLCFRSVPDSPLFPGPVISEDQFICSVIRLACLHRSQGEVTC